MSRRTIASALTTPKQERQTSAGQIETCPSPFPSGKRVPRSELEQESSRFLTLGLQVVRATFGALCASRLAWRSPRAPPCVGKPYISFLSWF